MVCTCCGYSGISDDGNCENCGEYHSEFDVAADGDDGGDRVEALEIELAAMKTLLAQLASRLARLEGMPMVQRKTKMLAK